MVVKWTFFDPTTSESQVFEINPNDGGSVPVQRNVVTQNTLAPGGNVVLQEGAMSVPEISFSGIILSEDQYNVMYDWFFREHQIELTDDLGRTMTIFITRFEPKRERAVYYPWKHSYSVTATVMSF